MKYFLITSFSLLSTFFATSQNVTTLVSAAGAFTGGKNDVIICGNFIQRLNFKSGGFPQDIHILNLDTEKIMSFRVKPTFKSSKENTFMYFIKPGNYVILNYLWTESKWYGGKMFNEPIFKDIDATDELEQKIKSGQIKESDLARFSFSVSTNYLNYLGTWHFDSGLVYFSDQKEEFDKLLKKKHKQHDFSKATTSIPE